jgi:hypothetical protein
MRAAFASLLLLAACGDDGGKATIDAAPNIDAAPDSPMADAPVDAPDLRGPRTVSFTGPANALFWDTATSTLYATDTATHTIVKYTDAGGVQTVGTLPVGTAMISYGDMVKQGGGTILVTNFGFGTEGNIYSLTSAGVGGMFTGLDVTRRRIGLAKDSNGLLYDNYFVGNGAGNQTGGVAAVALAAGVATETEIAGMTQGLKKVVGLVATPTAVFVSDQTQKKIFKIAIPGNAFSEVTATALPSADLLAIMPNGDLLTGGGTTVQRVTQAGVATDVFTGFEQVHGLAYDPTLKRLFIVDHSLTVGVNDKLHIRPLDN